MKYVRKHALAVAEEHVMAVPLIHAEVDVEAVGDGVPGHLPAHPRLQARDVRLRCARGVCECGVAGIQVGEVGDLIGPKGAAAAGMFGPAENPGFEEGAVDDQLTPAFEQVEEAHRARRPFERVRLLDGHPRHPPAFGGQRVMGPHLGLLLHEQLLARSLPLPPRHDLWCAHCGRSAFSVGLMCRHRSSLHFSDCCPRKHRVATQRSS
jgi:hypothetical protein